MANAKKYYVMMPNGQEFGPYEESRIIAFAKEGKITPECHIRSELVMSWEKADKMKFLRAVFIPILEKRAIAGKDTDWEKFKRQISLRGDEMPDNKIAQEGFNFSESSIILRFIAALLDIFFLTIGATILAFGCLGVKAIGIFTEDALPYFAVVVMSTWVFFYYIWGWCHRLQTFGQRMVGLVLIRPNQTPLYPGRAACYFFLMIVFGLLSPITEIMTMNKGTLQEYLTGTMVMRLTRSR